MNAGTERRLNAIETSLNATNTPLALVVVCHRGQDGTYSVDGNPPHFATVSAAVEKIEQERGIRACGCIVVAAPPPLPDEDRDEVST